MRLLLDAHVSVRRIGDVLRAAGHDVRAAADEDLEGWSDEVLLALAAQEERIMVTFNVGDFVPLVQLWARSGKHHLGCILMVGMDTGEFGVILRAIQSTLEKRPDQRDWQDYTEYVGRGAASFEE